MKRDSFGSKWGSVLALIGSAVGLGNIWRFPFLVGEYGGGAFIVIYLLCILLLSLPIMLAEFVIGRRSQANAFGAFRKLAPGTKWTWLGILCVATPTFVLAYYCVIGGWAANYLFRALTFSFTGDISQETLKGVFSGFVSSNWNPLLWHLIFLGLTAAIVSFGVKGGIERLGKIFIPVLFFFLVAITVYVMTLPGAKDGFRYLFKPDFSKVDASMCSAALGQAFFSLSIGFGTMLTYASYLSKKSDLISASFSTAISDMFFALLASCAILPAVFSFGLDAGQGPSLAFETLPFVFSKMPGGSIIAILFFFGLFLAALTSSVSVFEVGAAFLSEERGIKRKSACRMIFLLAWVIGIVCSLSFGALSGVRLFGKNIFDFCDSLSANYLMTIGAFFMVIFVGWKLKKEDVFDEITNGGTIRKNAKAFNLIYFLIRYISPIAVLAIIISSIL